MRGKNQETKYRENEVGLTKTPQTTASHIPHQNKRKKTAANQCFKRNNFNSLLGRRGKECPEQEYYFRY